MSAETKKDQDSNKNREVVEKGGTGVKQGNRVVVEKGGTGVKTGN